jgi:fructose-specific phosphotransferase system IIC component
MKIWAGFSLVILIGSIIISTAEDGSEGLVIGFIKGLMALILFSFFVAIVLGLLHIIFPEWLQWLY